MDDDLARFCLFWRICTDVSASAGSSLLLAKTYIHWQISIVNGQQWGSWRYLRDLWDRGYKVIQNSDIHMSAARMEEELQDRDLRLGRMCS